MNIIEIFDLKINVKFLEISFIMNKLFGLVDEKMLSFVESMKVKLNWLELKIVEIG